MEKSSTEEYAIICDVRVQIDEGVDIQAMIDRDKAPTRHWTTYSPELIFKITNLFIANKIFSRLKYNNPRIVPYATAVEAIRKQREILFP
jgi:hypothetical protein